MRPTTSEIAGGDRARRRFPQGNAVGRGALGRAIATRAPAGHDGAGGAGAPGERRGPQCAGDQPGARGRRGAGPSHPIKPTTSRWRSCFSPGASKGGRAKSDALDPDVGTPAGAGRSRGDLGLHRSRGARKSRDVARAGRAAAERRKTARRIAAFSPGQGDNSNTQFALLGLWAAGRHGFDSDLAAGIDRSATSARRSSADGRWGYRLDMPGSDAMSCAGLMGLAIAASRPSLAERQTARARGAALAADPAFQAALKCRRPGRPPRRSSVRHLLPLVARAGLRRAGPALARRVRLVRSRRSDPDRSSARRRRLAPRPLGKAPRHVPRPPLSAQGEPRVRDRSRAPAAEPGERDCVGHDQLAPGRGSRWPDRRRMPAAGAAPAAGEPAGEAGADDVKVIVTGASEQSFPRISVQFEVKRPDGSFLLDAGRDDFRVTEEGRDVDVVEFQAPLTTEAIPTTVVLVVDRSLSMEEEDRIGGLKRAVNSFLEKLPEGSRVAVIAFGSEVDRLSSFTTDRGQIKKAVDALEPAGATRFYDAVAVGPRDARPRVGPPRRPRSDGRRRHVQSVGQPRIGDRGRATGSACRSTRSGWEPRKRSKAPISAAWPSRRAASTIRLATPTSSARSTNRSPSESVRATRWSIRAIASFPTARCGRCGSSIAAADGRRDGRLHSGHGRSGRRLVAALSRLARRTHRPDLSAGSTRAATNNDLMTFGATLNVRQLRNRGVLQMTDL